MVVLLLACENNVAIELSLRCIEHIGAHTVLRLNIVPVVTFRLTGVLSNEKNLARHSVGGVLGGLC